MSQPDERKPGHTDAERILESITDAFFALDNDWRFTYLNSQAERLLARTREELQGKNVWEEFPAAVGAAFDREYHRAVEEQTTVSFEAYYPPPLDTWFEVRAYPSPDGLSVYFHDVTERKQFAEALRQSEARYRSLVDAASQIVWTNSPEGEMRGPNPGWGAFTGQSEEEYVGYGWARAVHPEDAQPTIDAWSRCVAERTPFVFEHRLRRHDGVYRTFAIRAFPVLESDGRIREWVGIHTDVTEQRESQAARDLALAQLEAVLASATDGIIVSDPIGNLLMWNPAGLAMHEFATLDDARRHLSEFPDLFVLADPDGVPIPLDEWPLSRLIRGETFTSYELRVRRLSTGREWWGSYSGSLARGPAGTVLLLVLTVRDISERKQAEAALTAAYRREALINHVNEAIRATTAPERIQETAAALLGEALGADRCYFSVYDRVGDAVRIAQDWRRPGRPSVAGEYGLAEYQEYVDALYAQGNAVINDANDPGLPPAVRRTLAGFGIRAFLAVPLLDDGRFVAALAAAMGDEARIWTPEEVSLMETVLTHTRTAVEAARLQQRERRIATELQDALQPPVPEHVPGLRLAPFMRAALDEAEVGGDFFDVFALDKGLYALVIGDVSGKGLAAAAQLATVRNSLRTTLYLYRAPAQAVTSLNAILTAHELLSGFVTAFVGIYDAGTGQITYASCGHEPALLRRAATGTVEALETTGLPLGAAENAPYGELSVTLAEGDCLLLYTDGLSEAGPSRRELLGTDGLTRLLAGLPTGGDVHETAARLVAEVGVFAHGVFRDDVCVLLIERHEGSADRAD